MAGPRPEKVAVVEEVREHLGSSGAAILTEYRGLKVGDLATLRRQLRTRGCRVQDLQEHPGAPLRLRTATRPLSAFSCMGRRPSSSFARMSGQSRRCSEISAEFTHSSS